MSMKELNGQLCTINRVVIHPKYRTIGLGAKLIRETLPLAGTRYVELIAVMAKYSPFAEKAGMQKVAIQEPSREVRIMSNTLERLGFKLKLIGSQKYVQNKLGDLTTEQMELLRDCLAKCGHPRFRKEFAMSRHVPYGKSQEFKNAIAEADVPKLAKIIKVVGMLLQSKVYLFWNFS